MNTPQLWASAGGGGGFGGSGGGGFGGGSGGFGGGHSFHIYAFGTGGSLLTLLVLVAVVVLLRYMRGRGSSEVPAPGPISFPNAMGSPHTPGGYNRFNPPPALPVHDASAITAHDPSFDLERFLEDAERTFFMIQQAWMNRDMSPARVVMASDIFASQQSQVAQLRADGIVNKMESLALADRLAVWVSSDNQRDVIVVRFHAGSSDYNMKEATGQVVSGSQAFREWWEDWTFVRPSQARSATYQVAANCPTCGAPLNADLAGVCTYCHNPIVGSDQGWRLAHIGQMDEAALNGPQWWAMSHGDAQAASTQATSTQAATSPAQPAPTNLPPAGWYDDTQTPGQLRYWDGSTWTTNVQPKPAS